MQNIKNRQRKLKYDLSQIQNGESILSETDDETFFYCFRKDEYDVSTPWYVFRYQCGEVLFFGHHQDPSQYIFPNHEIFDKEKSDWIYPLWLKTIDSQDQITDFKSKLKKNFLF